MTLSDYEKFQQQMFDELDELEEADAQTKIKDFIRIGIQCGIDVISEIANKRMTISEVVDEVRKRQAKIAK